MLQKLIHRPVSASLCLMSSTYLFCPPHLHLPPCNQSFHHPPMQVDHHWSWALPQAWTSSSLEGLCMAWESALQCMQLPHT